MLLKTIFLKLYLSTNVHFRRIFSTAPELHYLGKKNQVVISIAYNTELTEIRTRFCRVCNSLHRGGVTNIDYEQVTAFLPFTTLPEN